MHLMYVDEAGDPGYPESGVFPATGGPTRFFVRAGVVVHGWKWSQIDDQLAAFKRSRQLAWDAEIKTKHIRRGTKAFATWRAEDRVVFIHDLLDTIGRELDVSILAVVIAKEHVDLAQRERLTNPAVRSLELLLERYNQFLGRQKDRSGLVILDSTESRNDENLRYFHNYLLRFSEHFEIRRIVEGTLFMPSHTTNMLQLADLCANVIYGRFSRFGGNLNEYNRIKQKIWIEKVWPEEKEAAAKEG